MENVERKSIKRGTLRIEALTVSPLGNNVYIAFEDGSDDAIVIDVAQGAQSIFERLKKLELEAKMIVNTHGHTDHTAQDGLLRKLTGAKIAIHELDAYRLASEDEASSQLGIEKKPIEPDIQLLTGQRISLGPKLEMQVLHTPGHTEGSICLYEPKNAVIFSGDTLFQRGYGRVDGSGADSRAMVTSLKMLLELPPKTDVYPGHGAFTTIESEYWLKDITAQES